MIHQNRIFRKKYHFLENSFSKFRPIPLSQSPFSSSVASIAETDINTRKGQIEKSYNLNRRDRNLFFSSFGPYSGVKESQKIRKNHKYNYDTHSKNVHFKILKEEAFFSNFTPNSVKNSSLPYYIQYNLLNSPEKNFTKKFLPYNEKAKQELNLLQKLHVFFPQKKVFLNSWILPFLGFVGFASMNPRLDSSLKLNLEKIFSPSTQQVLPSFAERSLSPKKQNQVQNETQNKAQVFSNKLFLPLHPFSQGKEKKHFQFLKAKPSLNPQVVSLSKLPKLSIFSFHSTPPTTFFEEKEHVDWTGKNPDFGELGPVSRPKEIFARFHLNRSFYEFLRSKGEEKIPKKLQKNQILLGNSSKFTMFHNETSPIHSYNLAKTWVDDIAQKDMLQLYSLTTYHPLSSNQKEKFFEGSSPTNQPIFIQTKERKDEKDLFSFSLFGEELNNKEDLKPTLLSTGKKELLNPKKQMPLFEKKQEENLDLLEKSNFLKILNTELKNNSILKENPNSKRVSNKNKPVLAEKREKSSHEKSKDLLFSHSGYVDEKNIEFLKKEISVSLRKLYFKKSLLATLQKESSSNQFPQKFLWKNQNQDFSSKIFDQKEQKEVRNNLVEDFHSMNLTKNPLLKNQKIFHYMKTLQKIENQEKFSFLSRFSAPTKKNQKFEDFENQSMNSFFVFENQKHGNNDDLQRFQKLKWMVYRLLVLRYFKTSIQEKLLNPNFVSIYSSSQNTIKNSKFFAKPAIKPEKFRIQKEIQGESKRMKIDSKTFPSENPGRPKIFHLHTPLLMQETLFSNEIPSYPWNKNEKVEKNLKQKNLGDLRNETIAKETTVWKNEDFSKMFFFGGVFPVPYETVNTTKTKQFKEFSTTLTNFEPLMFRSSQNVNFLVPFSNFINKIYNTTCFFLGSHQSNLLKNHDILSSPFLSTSSFYPLTVSKGQAKKERKSNQKNLEKIFRAYLSCKSNQTSMNSSFSTLGTEANLAENAMDENSVEFVKKFQLPIFIEKNRTSERKHDMTDFFSQKTQFLSRVESKSFSSDKEESLFHTTTKTFSPNKLLKRFGFLFLNKNEMESKNSFFKQKYQQKKRRRKKLKLENRRRKKRKRFYPRPIWLRLNLYKSFYTRRFFFHEVSPFGSAESNKNRQNFAFFHDSSSQKPNSLSLRSASKRKKRNAAKSVNKSSFAVFNHHSQYQISNTVMSDFQRFCWKSYWLRSNLTPYIQRVQTKLKKMREVQSMTEKKSFLKKNLSDFVGFHFFVSPEKSFLSENSEKFVANSNFPFQEEIQTNVNLSNNLRNIAEYDRILYDRISEILQNVKTNLNGNGQNHARSFKRGHLSKTLTTNSPVQTSSQRDPEFQSKKKKKSMFEKMETFLNPEMDGFSFFDQKTKPYGDLPTLRSLWALNQTHVLNSLGGTKFSRTKRLWATFKIREQNKANKTKKFLTKIQNSAKIKTFNLSPFSNSNVSLSSTMPYAFHSRQTPKEDSEEQRDKETKEIENKSLYFAKTKLNTIENKLQYLGLSIPYISLVENTSPNAFFASDSFEDVKTRKNFPYWQKTEKNAIFHLENSNYKNILRQLKFRLKYENDSSFLLDPLNTVEKEEPRKQFSSRIQFWWFTNKSNPNLFLSLKNSNDFSLFPVLETKKDSPGFSLNLGFVESCSILFHIFCLFSFLRISEIRSFLKFFLLVFYKLSNSYLAITSSLYHLFLKYQKQTEETFVVLRQNALPFSRTESQSLNSSREMLGSFSMSQLDLATGMETRKTAKTFYGFHPTDKTGHFMSIKHSLNAFPFRNQNQKEKFLNLEFSGTNQKVSTFFEFSFYVPSVPMLEKEKNSKMFSRLEKKTEKQRNWPFILGEKSESLFLLKSSIFVKSRMDLGFESPKRVLLKEGDQKSPLKSHSPMISMTMKAYTYLMLASLTLRKISVQSFSKIGSIFYFGLRIILDIFESFMLIIYKFLEKPAEFMVEWIAELFLVEWSSDVRTFVPESFDIYAWSSFKKMTRGSFVLGPAGFFLQRRLWYFMEIFMNLCKKPDSDLNARQKKGILFWDIWAEILTEAAKKYQINLQSLTTNSSEQDSFFEKLLNDPFLFDTPYASSLQKSRKNRKTQTKFDSRFLSFQKRNFLAMKENGTDNPLFQQNILKQLNPNEYRWSANQYFTGRELDTDLFVDIHPPKSFNHISTTISLSGYQSLGQIVQQIYSGIFEKQVAKNVLIVGERGSGKSLLVQALAGETSIRLISDNAHRYAVNIKGVAVGMKLLRDVFDALALQTPCLFLMEDIHKIGERRPMLISDDENSSLFEKKNSLRLTTGNEEVHEKNQLIYQLSKHSISNYKRPYKGDFSFLIPTNHFCFDLFLGKSAPKTRKNFTSPKTALFENLRNSTLNAEIENESLKTSFGNQKEIFMSHLMIPSTTGFAPPATSPFTILGMKEQQKFKVRKLVQEMPWGGFSTDQLMLVKLSAYSIRVKVALLADMAMNKLLTKLDMITDLLVIMDNVRTNKGFVVFATTHVPFVLDPALRRPGRFDETIKVVSKSNFLNRYEILKSNFSHYSSTVDFLDYSLLLENSIGSLQANAGELNSKDFIQKTKLLLMSNYSASNEFSLNQNSKTTSKILQANFKNTSLNQAIRLSSLSLFIDSEKDSINVNNQMLKFFYPYKQKENPTKSNTGGFNLSIPVKGEKNYVFSNFSVLSLAYSRISRFFIQSQFLKDNRAFRLMLSIPYGEKLENKTTTGGEEWIFRDFYSKNSEIQHQLMFLLAGKVGEFFVLNNFQNPQSPLSNAFLKGEAQKMTSQSFAWSLAQNEVKSIEMDAFWRSAMTFVFSLIQKRFLYQKNLMATRLFDFTDKEIHMEPPSPPISKILMPTKKYENFKRVERDFQQKPLFNIQQKIQLHQQQRFMKSLYQKQISPYHQKNSSISEITKELAYIENSLNKPSSVNCYYKSRILNRHRFSRINHWWNAQLAEHNVETSRLSDVDWRSMFSESFGDLTIDYPDAEQYYNPKYRRWFLQSSYGGYWLSFQKTILFEIYQHFMILCYNKVYNSLENEREILDYFASMYLQKAIFQEMDFISTLSRFSSSPPSTKES